MLYLIEAVSLAMLFLQYAFSAAESVGSMTHSQLPVVAALGSVM